MKIIGESSNDNSNVRRSQTVLVAAWPTRTALTSARRARLRAAAPDLLEFVVEWLSSQGNDKNYMTEKARAAIAKATGEQK